MSAPEARRFTTSTSNVGFIGLGKMGTPMTFRLLKKFNNLMVFDKSESNRRQFEGKTKVACCGA